jgi:hypothetical protein
MELQYDEGWDDNIVGTPSRGYLTIKNELASKGLIAHSKGNTYIYVFSLNKWGVLISPEAQRQICDMTGSESATVNYLGASLPYLPYMEKYSREASSVPPSICIGTRRLEIKATDDGLSFEECKGIISVAENLDDRVQQFCVMPFSFDHFSTKWSLGNTSRLYNYLRVLFSNDIEFDTVRWIIGMAATDPGSVSKFLLLYGPGGTGKSTLISAIEDIFRGCSGTLLSSTLVGKGNTLSAETCRTIASNRIVTAGDLNLEGSQLNIHAIKEITGHDSVSIPPIKVRTRCSLVCASNDLPNPITQPTFCTSAVSRRIVVIPMNIKTSAISTADRPTVERPDSTPDLIEFLYSCLNVYIERPYSIPMSMRSLLLGILGTGYVEIEPYVEEGTNIDRQDTIDANLNIETYFKIPLYTIGELAYVKCPSFVVNYGNINFIHNIRLTQPLVRSTEE